MLIVVFIISWEGQATYDHKTVRGKELLVVRSKYYRRLGGPLGLANAFGGLVALLLLLTDSNPSSDFR